MPGIDWTKEQNRVINTRDKSILVAAGAGSGKTTVLVERIIKMITDKENPIDIDKFLIVTFTRSAAAQMKEKIRDRLYKLSLEKSDDENIRRQMSLVHTANISTIDSFANKIVSEHFEDLDIDPNFRVIEQEEEDMLIEDAIAKVMDEYYESEDQEFLDSLEMLAEGSPTADISEDVKSIPILEEGWHFAEEGATEAFKKSLDNDYKTLQALRDANTYDEYREVVLKYNPIRITASKFEGREIAAEGHYLLKSYSEHFTGGKEKGKYSYIPTLEEAYEDVNKSQKLANMLVEMTK